MSNMIGVQMSVYHRTYTRMNFPLNVQVQFKGEIIGQTLTRNINQFGAFIELSEPELETNDFVKIYFINQDDDSPWVVQKGMVMHSSKEGVGVLFASDTQEFRTMLEQEMNNAVPSSQAVN